MDGALSFSILLSQSGRTCKALLDRRASKLRELVGEYWAKVLLLKGL